MKEIQSIHVEKALLIFVVTMLLAGIAISGSATGQSVTEDNTGGGMIDYGNYTDTNAIDKSDKIGKSGTTKRIDLVDGDRSVLGERVWPVETDASDDICVASSGEEIPATGPGAANWFGYNGCGTWKVFDVQPGETHNITTYTDDALLYDDAYAVQEFVSGSWRTQETYPAIQADKTNARVSEYTPSSDRIRILNTDGNSGVGFYLVVTGPEISIDSPDKVLSGGEFDFTITMTESSVGEVAVESSDSGVELSVVDNDGDSVGEQTDTSVEFIDIDKETSMYTLNVNVTGGSEGDTGTITAATGGNIGDSGVDQISSTFTLVEVSGSPVDGISDELWTGVTVNDDDRGDLSLSDLGNAIQEYQKNPSDADVNGVSISLSDLGRLIQHYQNEVA
jgi:hypothetical protein